LSLSIMGDAGLGNPVVFPVGISPEVPSLPSAYLSIRNNGVPVGRLDCDLSSSNENVAIISSVGSIFGLSNGITTIKAVRRSDGLSGSFTFRVGNGSVRSSAFGLSLRDKPVVAFNNVKSEGLRNWTYSRLGNFVSGVNLYSENLSVCLVGYEFTLI